MAIEIPMQNPCLYHSTYNLFFSTFVSGRWFILTAFLSGGHALTGDGAIPLCQASLLLWKHWLLHIEYKYFFESNIIMFPSYNLSIYGVN